MFERLRWTCSLALIVAASVIACSRADAQESARSSRQRAEAPDSTVAVVDGLDIKAKDLDAYSLSADARQLFALNQQLHDSRRDLFESLADEQLLEAEAARAGITVSDLLNRRLKVTPVTDAEIARTFKKIRDQRPAITHKQMLPEITAFLQGLHRAQARAKYLSELRQAAR